MDKPSVDSPRVGPTLLAEFRGDLKRKQEVLRAACRCLENENSYRFFSHLSAISEMAPIQRERLLRMLGALGTYEEKELQAIRRLVNSDGASAFKDLVDMVRDIRIQKEIAGMLG